MMKFAITEQNSRALKTRDIAEVEAQTPGDALNLGTLPLPDWCEGCAIDTNEGENTAMIIHPTDSCRFIAADPIV
jgi:hypothetical protein